MKNMVKSRLLLALLLLLASAAVAQSPVTFQYFYDDARQLSKVVDSSGNVVEYVYDAAGNIVQINRSTVAAGALAVFNFTTVSGAPGTLVTIQGQGFSTNPSLNTVMFNGVAGTVISATANTLVVVVPAGATSGPISVTVGGNTSTSSTSFNVTTLPPGTTLPTVSIASLTNGQSVVQGQTINIALNVTPGSSPVQAADISAGGQFLINGLGVPYRRNFTVPYGVTSLIIGARVRDQAGNYGAATPITLTVVADPLTAVQGTVQDKNGNNITGASVAVKLNGLLPKVDLRASPCLTCGQDVEVSAISGSGV